MGGAGYKVDLHVALHSEVLQVSCCIEQQAVSLQQVKNNSVTVHSCSGWR